MSHRRAVRAFAVIAAAALVVGAFTAAPATAKKKKGCAKYVPGEQGAEAETTVLTDEATEEAPVEVEVEAPPGLPEVDITHVFHNVQVNSKAKSAGLFVRYEFPAGRDYDLFLNLADGTEVASAAGFNPTPYGPFDGTGNGGHSEMTAEQIDGLLSPKCAGYTVDMATYLGEGGTLTLKLWLGEPAA